MSDQNSRSPVKSLLSLFYALGICAVAGSAFYFLALQPAATGTQPDLEKMEKQSGLEQKTPSASATEPQNKSAEKTAESATQDSTRPAKAQAKMAKSDAEEAEREALPGEPGAGEKLYAQHCAVCHGADAKGQIGPDLTDDTLRYGKSPEALTESIANGRPGGMPAFGGQLSDVQIDNLVAYIRSL